MHWWQTSIILSSYGFFKEYRPSEPFITPYLTRFKNFTIEEVNQDIYPLGTYFYLVLLIAVFLLTDLLLYKPVLLAGTFSAVVTWCLLIYGQSLVEMQMVEFFYGVFMASEVAYFTYIYTKVDKAFYQKVTSHARAAFLAGKASAGLSSQLFVHFKLLDYLQLNYLTIGGMVMATLSSFFLPSVKRSLYFHRCECGDEPCQTETDGTEINGSGKENKLRYKYNKWKAAFCALFEDFRTCFSNATVLRWSVWWAFATCGFLQVISYAQLLWEDITLNANSTLYHGYVECASSLLGAAISFYVGYLNIAWDLWGEVFLGIVTIAQGFLLFYCSYLKNLYLAYLIHIVYQVFYQVEITVANCEVAKHIRDRSYALVFGINTFMALIVQTILTTVVINTLKISIRNQFIIYGGFHITIGVIFLILGISTLIYCKIKKKSFT